jgi:hypothetical protein
MHLPPSSSEVKNSIPLLRPYAFMAWTDKTLPFTITIYALLSGSLSPLGFLTKTLYACYIYTHATYPAYLTPLI